MHTSTVHLQYVHALTHSLYICNALTFYECCLTEKKQRDAKRASKSGTAAASATDEADLAQERRRKKNIANQQEFDNMIMVRAVL
jgi:hypothetical protein